MMMMYYYDMFRTFSYFYDIYVNPIIDIESEYSFKQGKIGESNIWDMVFEQAVPAKELANKDYVLATGRMFRYSDDPKICLAINGDEKDHFLHG